METGKYTLVENGRVLHRSVSFEKLLNFTAKENTKDARIMYNGRLIWVQDAGKYWAEKGFAK